jgi:hypothetical protein
VGVDAGPDIVTSGLVLAYDAAGVRSFPGTRAIYNLSGSAYTGSLVNGVSYSVPTTGDGSLRYTMVNNSSGHPTTTEGLTSFFQNGTSVIYGTHTGRISWAGQGQAIRWGGTADGYPSYHTRADNYGWQVDGFIYIPSDGSYNFLIDGDDACDFFIGGQLCSYWYGGHGFGTGATGTTKTFYKGWYNFTARMEEQGGGDGVAVGWQKPGDAGYSTIPGDAYSTYVPASSPNSALTFDGVDDSIDVSIDLRTNFSLECWVNYSAISGFSFFGQGPTSLNQGLHIWNTSTSGIRFGMYGNDTDFYSLSLSTNTWYHFVFTYNHSSPYTKQMFFNGVQQTGTEIQAQSQYSGTGTLRIGAIYGSGNYAFANGKFALVRVYNKILSASEVLQNFNAHRDRFGV